MKILVFSDSHGRGKRMAEVLKRSDADVILFLGDGIRDFDDLCQGYKGRARFMAVKGNCDPFDGTPEERVIELDGIKALMLHGHTKGVKHGTALLEKYAEKVGTDLVLYGHTHKMDLRRIGGKKSFYIFNPGSIGASFYDSPSFGYIEIVNGQLVINCTEYEEI